MKISNLRVSNPVRFTCTVGIVILLFFLLCVFLQTGINESVSSLILDQQKQINTTQATMIKSVERIDYLESKALPVNTAYSFKAKITYYCLKDKRTASGTICTPNRTIAASSQFPFGTVFAIEGDPNIYIVEDRMKYDKNNRVDIYVESQAIALSSGVKDTTVYVLKWGE